jgi:hypothetical protein
MRRKLNGWQRLWVVVAGLGFLAAIQQGLFLGAKYGAQYEWDVARAFDLPECKAVIDMPSGTKLDPEPHYESPCVHLHIYRSVYEDAPATKEGYSEHIAKHVWKNQKEWIGGLLLIWAVSIGLLYAAGRVVAWVVHGFRSA